MTFAERHGKRLGTGLAARGRGVILVLAVALGAAVWGCATRERRAVPLPEGEDTPAVSGGAAVCRAVEGSVDSPWYARERGETWTEGGSYFTVCRSGTRRHAPRGEGRGRQKSREDAEADALRRAYEFAFEKLERRDVAFADWQVQALIRDRLLGRGRGEEIDFPRIRIAASVIEICERPSFEGETWRATLLVEYPIAFLKGDVNNVRWHESRVEKEADVLVSSARSLFAEGRWFDAMVELDDALSLFRTVSRRRAPGGSVGEIDSLRSWAAGALSVEPLDGIRVVEVGERRETEVRFGWSYEWEDRTVPAVRLPVSFRPHGFDAVFANDSETDASGTASFRIVVAYGDVGEHAIEPRLDHGVLAEAFGQTFAGRIEPYEGPLHPVFLVEGAHAVTVCVEIEGLDPKDETQVLSGFERRMERDGFRVAACSPDVDVVVSVDGWKRSYDDGEIWNANVALTASAFDQRVAEEVGRPSIRVDESATEGQRESEVLALKEAGRLLGAYLTHRILSSGG